MNIMDIKQYRINAGLTQEDTARRLSITLGHYQKIEAGKHIPNVLTGLLLAKIFNCNPYELFGVD